MNGRITSGVAPTGHSHGAGIGEPAKASGSRRTVIVGRTVPAARREKRNRGKRD